MPVAPRVDREGASAPVFSLDPSMVDTVLIITGRDKRDLTSFRRQLKVSRKSVNSKA